MGWVLQGYSFRHDITEATRYTPDLVKDRFYVWLTRLHLLPPAVVGLALYALGGWPFLLWGLCLCSSVMLHTTWLVNSATHMWGTRRFETRDDSRNSWWVALLTFGEGWHNNHHASPAAARHGLVWYEIDMNWWCIHVLQRLGIASGVRLASGGTSVPGLKRSHRGA